MRRGATPGRLPREECLRSGYWPTDPSVAVSKDPPSAGSQAISATGLSALPGVQRILETMSTELGSRSFLRCPHAAVRGVTWWALMVPLALSAVMGAGCTADPKKSAEKAQAHTTFLAPAIVKDVLEVRTGMPQAQPHLELLWKGGQDASLDPEAARDALNAARNKVQDLRIVKSTVFAVVGLDGTVIRTDQSQDLMAGKPLFAAFPTLRAATQGKYTEAVGAMHEARGVEGKPDGQWLAAQPITADGKVAGVYVSGWAWSLYAHRLETALQSHLLDLDKRDRPLCYVFVVVGKQAYGTRVSPLVNAEAIAALDPIAHLDAEGRYQTTVEITGRQFGVAFTKVPELGADVAVAVLRSET
jgi:hypothetical protein